MKIAIGGGFEFATCKERDYFRLWENLFINLYFRLGRIIWNNFEAIF